MSFSGSKRSYSLLYTCSLVVLLTISTLLLWASTECKVEASRILQEAPADAKRSITQDDQVNVNMRKISSHFREFVAPHSHLNNNNSTEGFQDDKRRVPSCPDPLHN